MITAKQTPVSELPRAIAEAMGLSWYLAKDLFNPLVHSKQFHELTGDPETHAKICDVLDEWFVWELIKNEGVAFNDFWNNPTYLTENGGWRAWWLRAYLQILLDGK